jgi:hypothetical protein
MPKQGVRSMLRTRLSAAVSPVVVTGVVCSDAPVPALVLLSWAVSCFVLQAAIRAMDSRAGKIMGKLMVGRALGLAIAMPKLFVRKCFSSTFRKADYFLRLPC